jgi:hypothetical protein
MMYVFFFDFLLRERGRLQLCSEPSPLLTIFAIQIYFCSRMQQIEIAIGTGRGPQQLTKRKFDEMLAEAAVAAKKAKKSSSPAAPPVLPVTHDDLIASLLKSDRSASPP